MTAAQEYRAGLPDSEVLAQKAADAADRARTELERAGTPARDAARAAEQTWNAAIAARSDLERRRLAAEHALQTCRSALDRAQSELAGAEASHHEAANTRALLPDPASLAAAAQEARQHLAAARHALTDAELARSGLLAAREAASARLPRLRSEHEAWTARQQEAARKHTALATRTEATRQEVAGMRDGPALLARRAAELGTALAEAERAHADAASALTGADAACRAASLAEREAATAESGFREGLARAEGAIGTAQASLASVLTNAVERLGPQAVLPEAEPSEAAEERARRKLDRLMRERDEMGPVNLGPRLNWANSTRGLKPWTANGRN